MARHYPSMAADARALATYMKLLRAGESVSREANRPLALYELTPSQFGVLEALDRVGPQCLSDLARQIVKSSGNLTLVVRNLDRRGLVRRSPGRKDRRFTAVALTAKGRAVIRSIFPGHAAGIVAAMSRLTAKEQESLGSLCRKLEGM